MQLKSNKLGELHHLKLFTCMHTILHVEEVFTS